MEQHNLNIRQIILTRDTRLLYRLLTHRLLDRERREVINLSISENWDHGLKIMLVFYL